VNVEVMDARGLARHAALRIAASLDEAVASRGTATLAVSGGSTPARMFAALADTPVPWSRVHVFQVDERIAPDGDPDRNLGSLTVDLLDRLPGGAVPGGVYPMPAAAALAGDRAAHDAADRYADELSGVAGDPPALDVVHLGIGDDGHTASLVPGDPALEVADRDVAVTAPYRGHRRLTMTYPVLARARNLVWLVAGAEKADALRRLVDHDATIPAGRVRHERAVVFADPPAASGLRRNEVVGRDAREHM
jgi:6-phosphogluconolactonase